MTKSVSKKLNAFFSQYPLEKKRRKELLLRSTDSKVDYVYFLKKGYVRQGSKNGNDIKLVNMFKPLSFFPLIPILNNVPNTYGFRAVTDIEYHRAPRRDVLKFIQLNNDVLYDLTCRLGLGLNRLLTHMTFLYEDEARLRVRNFLWVFAARHGVKQGKYLVMGFPITHKEIASFTGLRRETVSREISALEKARKLKIVKRQLWVLDEKPSAKA